MVLIFLSKSQPYLHAQKHRLIQVLLMYNLNSFYNLEKYGSVG